MPTASLTRLPPGTQFGEYLIEDWLGAGAAGTVYRARQVSLQRVVALKILTDTGRLQSRTRERFLQEGRLAARVSSPRVVRVFEAGEAQGVLYLAYEVILGGTLRALLRREVRLTVEQTLAVAAACAEALEAIHQAKILHRDVKPENIFISPERGPLLGDLGCAKDLTSNSIKTTQGYILGTPVYMAPETAVGEPHSPAADLYALGIVAFECLTGRPPFLDHAPTKVLFQHVTDPVPDLRLLRPDLGPGFAAFIELALAKSPERRFPSATEFRRAVLALRAETTGGTPQADSTSQKTSQRVGPDRPALREPATSKTPSPAAFAPTRPLPLPPWHRLLRALLAVGLAGAAAFAGWRLSNSPSRPEPVAVRTGGAPRAAPVDPPRQRAGLLSALAALPLLAAEQERGFRQAGPGASPDTVRQLLNERWNLLVETAGSAVLEDLAAQAPGRAEAAGAILVRLFRTRQRMRSHFAGVVYAAQARVSQLDLLGLDSLAIWTVQMERGLEELAASPARLLRRLPADGPRPAPPLLEAGVACLVAMARPATENRNEGERMTQRVVDLARRSWSELIPKARNDDFDADVAGALLMALRDAGAGPVAQSLVDALPSRSTDDFGGSERFDPRAQLLRFELDSALTQALHDPMFFATDDPTRRKGFQCWLDLRERLLQRWPWDLRDAEPPASWPGYPPAEVRRLHASARERLELARLLIERLRGRLGLPPPPEPGPFQGTRDR
jgi:serine/threonine-protein kinase